MHFLLNFHINHIDIQYNIDESNRKKRRFYFNLKKSFLILFLLLLVQEYISQMVKQLPEQYFLVEKYFV
jgi:hypothetical protein